MSFNFLSTSWRSVWRFLLFRLVLVGGESPPHADAADTDEVLVILLALNSDGISLSGVTTRTRARLTDGLSAGVAWLVSMAWLVSVASVVTLLCGPAASPILSAAACARTCSSALPASLLSCFQISISSRGLLSVKALTKTDLLEELADVRAGVRQAGRKLRELRLGATLALEERVELAPARARDALERAGRLFYHLEPPLEPGSAARRRSTFYLYPHLCSSVPQSHHGAGVGGTDKHPAPRAELREGTMHNAERIGNRGRG
ncbi:unnamed protein product [Prorocentrum cordatum]|uniref:Uncharacterized protein n=1 Tax=Prorocentrum cordatum TaxID=2364126 RepID=A0ABN9TGC0_9DINO|nr:unnamed protein product [Polarella glacialis]